MPGKIHPAYTKMYGILNCATMHALLFTVLYKVSLVLNKVMYFSVRSVKFSRKSL